MTDVVIVETDGPVRVLKMHRPDKLNALNNELSDAVADAIEAFEADDDLRVMVIGGSTSRAFSAGGDMREAVGRIDATAEERTRVRERLWSVGATARKPLIGAIEGYCYGSAAALAMHFDIRVCGDNAKFQNHSAEYGIVYGLATLATIIGPAKAKEIAYTGRVVEAAEATAIGIFNIVVPVGETWPTAMRMAHQIARNSAAGIAAAKRVIEASCAGGDALALEQQMRADLLVESDHKDRFRGAFARKVDRAPASGTG